MSPAHLFTIVLLITGAAAASEFFLRKVYRKRLQKVADEWGMSYSPLDQLRLTPRVARNFPVAGAANIRVVDLIYGSDCDEYRYVFTAEYTAGVVSGKHRVLRAGTFSEPRDRTGSGGEPLISLASKNLPLIEQYRTLSPRERAVERSMGSSQASDGPR
ncbi:MAG TPA: hypothetical protein VG326_05815 [Tepidisphaeraceae bacterium]|jgi:hypothetical protein|nr:hypothetical protein [Tepidisphaeraceae bacterium]